MFQQSDVETYLDRVVWGSLSSSFPLTDYGKSGTTIHSVGRVNERTISTELQLCFLSLLSNPSWSLIDEPEIFVPTNFEYVDIFEFEFDSAVDRTPASLGSAVATVN